MKTVIVGIPTFNACHEGAITVALLELQRVTKDTLTIVPIITTLNPLHHARNFIVQEAVKLDADILLWVDADMRPSAVQLAKLLLTKEDFVALPYRIKNDERLQFVVYDIPGEKARADGLKKVEVVGFGTCKMTRKVFEPMYRESLEYAFLSQTFRLVCDFPVLEGGAMCGEDAIVCRKWRAKGEHVYMDTTEGQTVPHVGSKVYEGDLNSHMTAKVDVAKEPTFPKEYGLHPDHCRDVLEGCYDIPFNPVTPPVILDIGANVGAFTQWAYRRWSGATVLAYEPNKNNFKLWLETVESKRDHTTVKGFNVAVADGSGKMWLGCIGYNCGEYALLPEKPNSEKNQFGTPWDAHEVEVIDATTLPKADILKLDTEGAELCILRSLAAANKLKGFAAVVLEYHADESIGPIEDILKHNGFKLIAKKVHSQNRGEMKFMKHALLDGNMEYADGCAKGEYV